MAQTVTAPLTPEETRRGERALARTDPVMRHLIRIWGPCDLHAGAYRPFPTLAHAIISQQLSNKAASTIAARVRSTLGGPLNAPAVLRVPADALRAAGLSQAKVRYLMTLADRVTRGDFDFRHLRRLPDDRAIDALTTLPGIGRWTAEMFLIFSLKRPDVLSLGDAGLQRAARKLYDERSLESCSAAWQPYRSIASWYLWRSLDNG